MKLIQMFYIGKMKLSNQTIINKFNTAFCAGKTKLYTDFDGTFFPYYQDDVIKNKNNAQTSLREMQNNFSKLLNKYKNSLSAAITTGRSEREMQEAIDIFKDLKIPILINSYVLENGAIKAEIKKTSNKETLTSESSSKDTTAKIKDIIKSIDDEIFIYEVKSNKNLYNGSEDFFENVFLKNPKEKYASIAKTSCGIEIAFSFDINTQKIYNKLKKQFLNIDIKKQDNNALYVLPMINNGKINYIAANLILLNFRRFGATKLNEAKNELSSIIQNNSNDLVIVSGDDYNDYEMLNPLNYLDLVGIDIKNKSLNELLKNKKTLAAIKNIPIISIIAGNGLNLAPLLVLKKELEKYGVYKIFQADSPEDTYSTKIEEAIKEYCKINKVFKNNLNISA